MHECRSDDEKQRPAGNERLCQLISDYATHIGSQPQRPRHLTPARTLGTLNGFPITFKPGALKHEIEVALENAPDIRITLSEAELSTPGRRILARLRYRLAQLPDIKKADEAKLKRLQREQFESEAALGRPFRQADELNATRARYQLLEAALRSQTSPADHHQPEPHEPAIPTPPSNPDITEQREPINALNGSSPASASTPARQETHPSDLAPLLKREEDKLRAQARALHAKLSQRIQRLQDDLDQHLESAPAPHDPARPAWTTAGHRIEGALHRAQRHRTAIRSYARTPLPGYPSKTTDLARKRLATLLGHALPAAQSPLAPRRGVTTKTGRTDPSEHGHNRPSGRRPRA